MYIKICGTTSKADAELAVALGADALGFIFAPSKRRVEVTAAAEMVAALPPGVLKVGVFTEPDAGQIAETAKVVGLTAAQLHMPFDPHLLARLAGEAGPVLALWQVIPVETQPADAGLAEQEFARVLRQALRDRRLTAILLDAARGGASGGLGESFGWARMAPVLHRELQAAATELGAEGMLPPRIVVAGGLHAGNVGQAIAALQPWGVDCVSGVEAVPGRKDPERLRTFLAAARGEG